MAAVLALVFRRRLRLVPLAVALAAVALTFGLMALVGAPLTMASIAVLPVLLGLGVDYAIQYQARIPDPPTARGAARGGAAGVPTIATAALATAAGFLVLLLSPVPMVRGFGVLLVLGVGDRARVRADRRHRGARAARRARPRRAGPLGARRAARRSCSAAAARPFGRLGRAGRRLGAGVLRRGVARPGRVLAVALAAAAIGWVVDTQTEVAPTCRSWCRRTCPRCATSRRCSARPAWRARSTSSSRGATWPTEVVAWMRAFQQRVLKEARYKRRTAAARPRCARRCRCPDLFQGEGAAADARRSTRCWTPCRRTSPRP